MNFRYKNPPDWFIVSAMKNFLLLAAFFASCFLTTPARAESFSVLLFSKTLGYRHGSIPDALLAIQELAATNHFSVTNTEDASIFNDTDLAKFRAVVFVMTTGDVLDNAQQAAFERFIRAGNGYVGFHSASDTEYDWPWYGGLVGAYFAGHSEYEGTLLVEDSTHPSTKFLPTNWVRYDEWYDFQSNPRANVHVLISLLDGSDHPIAWCHDYDGGRAWYTAGGHTPETYSEPLFRRHLVEGIIYAANWKPKLTASRATNNFVLTWPVGPDFSVESRSALSTNQNWTSATNLNITTTNDQNIVRIPASNVSQFFRLTR